MISTADVCDVVLARASEALADAGSQPIQRSHLVAGLVAWDDPCGMLNVAPERLYKTASFPVEGPDVNGCFDGLIAVDLVVVLVRCVPTINDRGEPPPVPALDAAYRALLVDAATLWNALGGPWGTPTRRWESTALAQTFVGAEGGAIAVETRFTLGLDEEMFCP